MNRHITRKFDQEKGKRRDNASKNDYAERFAEEGDSFDRAGKAKPKLLISRGSTLIFNRRPIFRADKSSVIRTLESWRFVFAGRTGTVAALKKYPAISEEVSDRFERTRNSVLRSEDIIGTAVHPKSQEIYPLLEFTCFLSPAPGIQNPIFKKCLAFQVKVVG